MLRCVFVLLIVSTLAPAAIVADDFAITLTKFETLRSSLEKAVIDVKHPAQGAAWVKHDSTNFSLWTLGTAAEAKKLTSVCEDIRQHIGSTWLGEDLARQWTPKCEIIVHPTLESYTRFLGPGSEKSNGCATIRLDSGRVVVRRIDVRGDAASRLASALPHELTHVILADAFPDKQIPRWADEGIAILAESKYKQERFAQDLHYSVVRSSAFGFSELMNSATYPAVHRRGAFYGQSASVVKFLVAKEGPQAFLNFVRESTHVGYDRALQSAYGIQGIAQLEAEWASEMQTIVTASATR